MADFIDFSKKYLPVINERLEQSLPPANRLAGRSQLGQAMGYSLLLPGKRIRPLLVLASCQICGGQIKKALGAAAAVEMVHAFSLIHDDLPALDNDDYRRGQPTNHKVFGEAQAILAGDGLLAQAFSVVASQVKPAALAARCGQTLAEGVAGMIMGESLDVAGFSRPPKLAELRRLNGLKTGRLIEASVVIGGLIGQATPTELERLRAYAEPLGEIVQLTDDLLDLKTDAAKNGSVTAATLLGAEKCRRAIAALYRRAIAALDSFAKPAVLISLAEFVRDRQA